MGDIADYIIDQIIASMDDDEYWELEDADLYPARCKSKPSGEGPCPLCKKPTVLKEGEFGKFFGCSDFPKCKGSRCFINGEQ
jgi:ssDNA-binding Zn-finger/Zn-ribbon topoisomerase 1